MRNGGWRRRGTDCAGTVRGATGRAAREKSNGTHTRASHRVPRRSIWPEYQPRSSTAANMRVSTGTLRRNGIVNGRVRAHARKYRAAHGGHSSYGDLMCGLPAAAGEAGARGCDEAWPTSALASHGWRRAEFHACVDDHRETYGELSESYLPPCKSMTRPRVGPEFDDGRG